jgi:hypothetical protein
MASKLFLRNTTLNGITDTGDGIVYDMLKDAAGAAADTAVVNTSASGTEIQWTKTAGGSTIAFISGRVPAGGFTLTTGDISIWALESNMNANCGGRYRVYRYQPGGTVTELGGGPFNDGVEFSVNPTFGEMTWLGNHTDQAFSENDRILIRIFITNVGTMGGGFTCTLKWNAADAAEGDSFFNIAETVTFKPEDQTVSPSAIASAEAFGTAREILYAKPSGLASVEAFGSDRLNLTLVAAALASAEAFGTATVNLRLLLAALASGEAFGTATVSLAGGTQTVSPSGIASSQAFGSAVLALRLTAVSIATGEILGTVTLRLTITPAAIASAEAHGTTRVNLILKPSSVAPLEAFGPAKLSRILTGLAGIASGEALGTPVVSGGLVLGPVAIGSAEAVGLLRLALRLVPAGLASQEALGAPTVGFRLVPPGVLSEMAFGLVTVSGGSALGPVLPATVQRPDDRRTVESALPAYGTTAGVPARTVSLP